MIGRFNFVLLPFKYEVSRYDEPIGEQKSGFYKTILVKKIFIW